MVSSIPISLSGLMASQKRLLASASNIANLRTTGENPSSSKDGKTTAYNPVTTTQKSLEVNNGYGAGVNTTIVNREDGTSLIYDPSSPFADDSGLVAVPNISLEEEITNLMMAKNTYKANAFALKTAQEMEKSLIDELA